MQDYLKKSLELIGSPEFIEKSTKQIKEKLKKEKEKLINFYNTSFNDIYNKVIKEDDISFEENKLFCDCIIKVVMDKPNEICSVVDVDNETTYYFYKQIKVISICGCSPTLTINDNGSLQKSETIFETEDFQVKKLTFNLNGKIIQKEFLYSGDGYVFDTFCEYLFENQLLSKAVK